MTSFLKRTVSAVILLATTSTFAQQDQSGEAPQMPPRMVGSLHIDPLTPAPLQVAKGAHLKTDSQTLFKYISSDDMKSMDYSVVKSDAAIGIYATKKSSDNSHGIMDHLSVVHISPSPDGNSAINWQVFFNHTNPDEMNKMATQALQSKVETLIEKFGGKITASAQGTDQVTIISDIIINAPVKTIWKKSADDFGGIDQWSSMVGKADLMGRGINTARTCHINMPGNPSVDEKMVNYDKKNKTFAYTISGAVMPPFVTKALNTWTLKDLENGKTLVRSQMTIDIAEGAPAPAVGMFKGQFYQMLGMSMEEFGHHTETGTPHARKVASNEMMKKWFNSNSKI